MLPSVNEGILWNGVTKYNMLHSQYTTLHSQYTPPDIKRKDPKYGEYEKIFRHEGHRAPLRTLRKKREQGPL